MRWPLRSQVTLNGYDAGPVPQQPQVWDGHGYKDRNEDRPLQLPKQHLRSGLNRLCVTSLDAAPHVVVLIAAEPRAASSVVESVRSERAVDLAAAEKRVVATFGGDDDDIQATATRLVLSCPLSMRRLGTPVRTAECRHLECFDLESYVELAKTSTRPRWSCPLCSASARPHQLRVDSWVAHVLEKASGAQLEVEVRPDGSFGTPSSSGTSFSHTGRKRKQSGDAAPLELSPAAPGSAGGSSASREPAPPKAEVIDIESGDDENHPICIDSD